MLTQERLKELLHYDPETGIFIWLISLNHINRIKDDNRWENLRLATSSQNSCNIKRSFGFRGVVFYKNRIKGWKSHIRVNGKEFF